MTIEGGGGSLEPNKEPAANGTPSPGKRNVNKAKRLLPMELRKRRRAAKLQVSVEKKSRVALDPPQIPSKSTRPTPTKGAREETQFDLDSQKVVEEKKGASTAGSPAVEVKKASPLARAEKVPPLATATRLHSLYASSMLSQKRRQLLPDANVPNIFHVTELPLDIVPKTKLSILTAFPYPFPRVNSQIKKQALQRFITGSGNSTTQSTSQSNAVRWQQSLHYFVHPADSVPTSMLLNRATAASKSEPLLGGPKGERKREEKAFLTARWNTWQESFRDVYMNFRRQGGGDTQDGSFYLRSSEFVVCFHYDTGNGSAAKDEEDISSIISLCQQQDAEAEPSAKEGGSKCAKKRRLSAVMSQSNARTRKVLHHLNVAYTMPYINANQTQREVGKFHMLQEELEANRSKKKDRSGGTIVAPMARATSATENMHGADSLLLFHGHDEVHGLYEFLVNRAPMSNQDVPELFALYPFANASIQSLKVTSFGRVGGAPTESLSDDQPSRATTLFRTEILGFCFPLSVARLLAVLKVEWEATKSSHGSLRTEEPMTRGQKAQIALRTYMEAVAGAERLNAVKLDEQVAKGEKCSDQQERQKRQQELEFSKRRVEAVVVTKMESRYDVETTTRPIVVRR